MSILIGFLSGIISGFGIGGGVILIPAMTIFMNVNQHTAQAINLVYFIPTAISALIIHFKNHNICLKPALLITASGTVTALFASYLAARLENHTLRVIFGIFLFLVGIMEFFKKPQKKDS